MQVTGRLASTEPCPFRHGKFQREPLCKIRRLASTEPCPFRQGKLLSGRSPAVSSRRFNGAMPFQAWVSPALGMGAVGYFGLQWSHALSGMVRLLANYKGFDADWLQRSHALSGRVSGAARTVVSVGSMLQRSHALSGRVRGESVAGFLPPAKLQRSHALSDRVSCIPGRRIPRRDCFNGAMPFQAW